MSVNVQAQNERQNLMSRLLDAVKQCQVRFGGKSELATESDYSVSCLCASWESVLQHGMKHTNKTLSTLKQMSAITGLNKIGSGISLLDNLETEPVFWLYVKEHLNKHEVERYTDLNNVKTDAGRGRAWIRSALNEHAMEKYMHMVIEDDSIISQYYEPWAFLRDQEKRNTLPNMAAGLASILFAISIDNEELNAIRPAKGLDELLAATTASPPAPNQGYTEKWEHYRPVIGGEVQHKDKKRDKKKKKKVPKIVSFDDLEPASSSSTSSLASPKVFRAGRAQHSDSFEDSSCLSSPTSPIGGGIVASGRGSIGQGLLNGGQSYINAETVSLSGHETSNSHSKHASRFVFGSSSPKTRSVSLSEMDSNVEIKKTTCGENNIPDVVPMELGIQTLHVSNSKCSNDDEVETEVKVASTDGQSTTANALKKFFNFGSSDDELKRSSSRTSLDSVQSSKSEQVNFTQENRVSAVKKGHRKSLSDTSMLVTNFGSRILKTVVEKTKKSFTLGETEGSLPSSLASSNKSLNEQTDEIILTLHNNESNLRKNNIEFASEPGQVNDSVKAKTDTNISNTQSVLSRIPTFDAAIGVLGNSYMSSVQKTPQESVQNQGITFADNSRFIKVSSSSSSQSSYTSQNTEQREVYGVVSSNKANVMNNFSATSLPAYSYDSENSEPAVASDLTPISPDGDVTFRSTSRDSPVSQDSTEFQSYTEATQQATLALALAQKVFYSSDLMRTQGDGSNFPDGVVPSPVTQDGMSSRELKEAIMTMMKRKDEIDEHNRHLLFALEAELEVSTALRMEIDEMKKSHMLRQEKDSDKIRNISRENDLLKHQLRKYVSAVQLLRRKGANDADFPGIHLEDEVQPAVPPQTIKRDYSHEAEQYEQKLIQVAEMHGELMEFNENLHRQIISKEKLVKKLQEELTELRGPLPADMPDPDDNLSLISEADGNYVNRPLINIWIPSAFLKGKPSDGYHVYQVYVRIRDEEWNIYRRYTDFLNMHLSIKKNLAIVTTFDFPPKKAVGNKEARFVEMRRKKLQVYLRKVINLMSQTNPEFTNDIDRNKLSRAMPFFGDKPVVDKKNKGSRRKSTGSASGRTQPSAAQQPHYSGL